MLSYLVLYSYLYFVLKGTIIPLFTEHYFFIKRKFDFYKQKTAIRCCYYRIESDMRTTVKTFLVFVLLMVTCSLGSRAVNFTGMVEKAASTCEVSASSSSLKNASSDNVANNTRSNLFTNSKFMWTTDAELGSKPISERYSFNPYRFRRAVETASVMRGLLMISSHHNLLVHDQSKLYYSDKDPHYTSFSSEYYIYTLRRIVI